MAIEITLNTEQARVVRLGLLELLVQKVGPEQQELLEEVVRLVREVSQDLPELSGLEEYLEHLVPLPTLRKVP